MSAPCPQEMSWVGRVARILVFGLLAYWGAFALVLPVTVWDAQVYNLARLSIAELHGLFGNPFWTSERQLMFPWAFDAIHLPFLYLGFGTSLPSYLCMVGTVTVAWRLLARRFGPEAGWLGALALLALPTLVYQSVVTKNDVIVLFGVATWYYAFSRWRGDRRRIHLVFMALAIGLTAGAKNSGLSSALFCGLLTLWSMRQARSEAIRFGALTAGACLLLGSAETYLESFRVYGNPFGPSGFVRDHRNQDGLRGAAANAVRYALGNVNLGVETWQDPNRITPALEANCRKLLAFCGLQNAGYRHDFNDANLSFLKNGWDAGSDFGPLGTIGFLLALGALCWWRPTAFWWPVAIFGLLSFATICASVAWMPWNHRFLVFPFAAFAVALVAFLCEHVPQGNVWRAVLLGLSAYSGIVFPLTSFNKRPTDLVESLTNRETEEFKERPTMLPVIQTARCWSESHPGGRLLLLAGSDSWVLPFLTDPHLHVQLAPLPRLPGMLAAATDSGHAQALLILNRPEFHPTETSLVELQQFPDEPGTTLFEVLPANSSLKSDLDQSGHAAGARSNLHPAITPKSGFFSDGWTAETFELTVTNWPQSHCPITLINPSPLARTVVFKSDAGEIRVALGPDETASVSVPANQNDLIKVFVTPAFVPRETTGTSDTRRLGIRLELPHKMPSIERQ